MQTPCADWNLDALIDHVTGGNWFTIEILGGESADVALTMTMERFTRGSASWEAASSAVAAQLASFSRRGVLDMTHDHVVGELTGRQILRLRLHDLIIHSWDIDATVGAVATVAPELSAWGLAELSDPDSLTAEHFGLTITETHPGVGAEATYLQLMGRSRAG